MKRRWFLVLGVGIIVANLGLLVTFDASIFEESVTVATNISFGFAGVLFALGGIDVGPGDIEWYQLIGLANVLMGMGMAATYLLPMVNGTSAYDGSTGIVLAVCAVVGGASIVFIGFDWMRGGRHFDLSAYEEGPIFSSWGE